MKKITIQSLMVAICCLATYFTPLHADNDKPIQVKDLPQIAQTILSQHFNGQKVVLATVETSLIDRSYDVVLQNGTKLEFDKNGRVTEVVCKQGVVPAELIPTAINHYLQENYPDQKVWKIEIQKNEYEVELTNGLEISFNKRYQVIDID